ncbi:MAG: glycosyltransferase family 4 protein [Euryarchaeota archaeon]|nr:glycosyltransferase family 4 protein [Euryarchaeota archaeon]
MALRAYMAKALMLLSNPYRPDPRVQREALALVGVGHSVTILSWDREGLRSSHKDGPVKVVRLGPRAGYTSPLDMVLKLPLFWKRAIWAAARERFDIVHAHDFDTLPLGAAVSWLRGVPLVYDAHERYSDMVAGSLPNIAIRFIEWLEEVLLRKASAFITVNDVFVENYRKKGARNPVAVMNCQDPVDAKPSKIREELGIGSRFTVIYIGVLEPERSLAEAIEAFKSLPKDEFFLVLGGFGSLSGDLKRRAVGLENVKVLDRVPSEMVIPHTMAADAVLVCFDPRNRNNRDGAPNKLFEAMAAGKPSIVAKGTYAARVAEEEKCGVAIEYGNADALANVVKNLRDGKHGDVGAYARRAFSEKYNWGKMRKRLLDAYKLVLSR